ncbi:MAG TPA: GAF domain-containing protein [Ktedonobacterales bacterium]|nr:GAF domain-containing protein [Ktedonobacterales bacterium]
MSENYPSVNTYHNTRTPPKPDERPEMVAFYNAADPVLALAAELARVVTHAHQGAATQMVNGDWSEVRKYFSLSEKYAAWADYHTPAVGFGIHAYITKTNQPLRLTQAELEAHPEWRDFGTELANHPPMRGWIAMPLIGADGLNYGLLQVSDRYEGDFTAEDEQHLARLVKLTSTALDALAMVHLPDYRQKIESLKGA